MIHPAVSAPIATPMAIPMPAHLVGTRAALFHLWRVATLPVSPAEPVRRQPTQQTGGPEQMRAALQADVFVFARTA